MGYGTRERIETAGATGGATTADRDPTADDRELAQLRTRFIEAVFLIAAGLRKREELFAANSRRHPYCNELRLGIERSLSLLQRAAARDRALCRAARATRCGQPGAS